MAINMEVGFTVTKIYAVVCNNLLHFALYLSSVFHKAKFNIIDIFG